ncbi:hypothetical protein F4553_001786 [Allocatelliglobosispora scoriae]|uniref:DUF397 domain-containing protein n=1 Tax=Allocatelliglobosispora scoriae TaxID=643052 RepID=A0A841BH50_9ACTN|nr:DUF397 domain-containing protein [Allocatelliglobosispora scoriae]MBB5868407.1 hypothetical protein [Allocatelliglobosispora scoriae]
MRELPNVEWRKSTRSDGQNACVEVALAGDTVGVRDSKQPDGAALAFTAAAWSDFVAGVKGDEFRRPRV